jgi:hypothetical protein
LYLAARLPGREAVVQTLLKAGADVNAVTNVRECGGGAVIGFGVRGDRGLGSLGKRVRKRKGLSLGVFVCVCMLRQGLGLRVEVLI